MLNSATLRGASIPQWAAVKDVESCEQSQRWQEYTLTHCFLPCLSSTRLTVRINDGILAQRRDYGAPSRLRGGPSAANRSTAICIAGRRKPRPFDTLRSVGRMTYPPCYDCPADAETQSAFPFSLILEDAVWLEYLADLAVR